MPSRTRDRESRKVHTPEQQWNALTKQQRAALLVMGEEVPVGVPWHAVQGLIDWYLVVSRASGFVLTPYGISTRDFGRGMTQ